MNRFHPAFPKPRCSEHRLQLIVMAGFPSFFQRPRYSEKVNGETPPFQTPPLRTNPYLNPLQKYASAAGSGDFSTTDSGVLISEQRCFGGRVGTAVCRSGGFWNGGVSQWRCVGMEGRPRMNQRNRNKN